MKPTIVDVSTAAASSVLKPSNGQLSAAPPATTPSTRFLLVLLIMATALPFLTALGYGFVYDDGVQAVDTVSAEATQPPVEFFFTSVWDFRHFAVAMNTRYFRPLFHTWLRINAALFGYNPVGWHLSTLGVHVAVTILVFFVLRRQFQEPWAAFAGAAVFGVHPVHLESVAWISGVTDPLAALGFLGSFLLWLRKIEEPRLLWQVCSLALFLAALLTKENTIVLPAVIFLYVLLGYCGNIHTLENWKERFRVAVWEALPYGVISIIYLGVRMATIPSLRNASLPWVPQRTAIRTLPSVIVFYLRHLVWPTGLTVFPDVRLVDSVTSPGFWIPLIILAAAAACAFGVWRGKRVDGVIVSAMIWFALPLLPVLDLAVFFKDDFVHDRYLYLPSVGLAICCAAAARRLLGEKSVIGRHWVGPAFMIVLVSVLAISTAAQSAAWRNNVTLYGSASKLSSNPVPRIFLAAEYINSGHLPEAREILERTNQQVPDSWSANYYLGSVDYQLKDLATAEVYLRRAIALDSAEPDEYLKLGLTLQAENRLVDSEVQLRSAIARNPEGEGYHYILGTILMAQGKISAGKDEIYEELKHPSNNAELRTQIEKTLGSAPPESSPVPGSSAARN